MNEVRRADLLIRWRVNESLKTYTRGEERETLTRLYSSSLQNRDDAQQYSLVVSVKPVNFSFMIERQNGKVIFRQNERVYLSINTFIAGSDGFL